MAEMFFTEQTLRAVVVVVFSYLLGSVPTAYLLAKTRNINIFEIGSGNMGGTNVARSLGLRWGILTMILDIFKGIVAVWVTRMLIMPDSKGAGTTIAAIVVIVGHNWSLFATLLTLTWQNGKVRATLKGGKGAATAFGTMMVIAPLHIPVIMAALAGLIIMSTRYVSLGVLVSFALGIMWLAVLVGMKELPPETTIYSIVLSTMLIIRFRSNIQRLATGTERRLGDPA